MNMILNRLNIIWQSYRSIPTWVQLWVGGILVPVNALPFFFLPAQWAIWGSLSALFVVVTNIPIMWFEQGMSRLMSIPHVLAWVPLEIFLIFQLMATESLSLYSILAIVIILIVNAISLVFDVLDSWRWIHGERDVPHPNI